MAAPREMQYDRSLTSKAGYSCLDISIAVDHAMCWVDISGLCATHDQEREMNGEQGEEYRSHGKA